MAIRYGSRRPIAQGANRLRERSQRTQLPRNTSLQGHPAVLASMTRRDCLAMLASSPIAALAPWSKVLATQLDGWEGWRDRPTGRLPIGHPSCNCRFCRVHRQYVSGKMSEVGGFDWYMDPEPLDVIRGRGFLAL